MKSLPLILLSAFLMGCSSTSEQPKLTVVPVEQQKLDISQLTSSSLYVYAQLHRIPDWMGGSWYERNSDYTVNGDHDLDEASRIFLVLRAIFKIGHVKREEAHSYGSFIRPISEEYYDADWPLEWKPDGSLRIHHSMGYCGAPYDPIGEMSYFMRLKLETK